MLRLGPPLSPRLSLLPACAAREQPSGSQAHVQGNLRNPLTPALHASSDAHRVHARLPPRRFNLAHHPLPSVAHARRAPAPHRRLLLLSAHVRLKGIEAHLLCNALDERPPARTCAACCARATLALQCCSMRRHSLRNWKRRTLRLSASDARRPSRRHSAPSPRNACHACKQCEHHSRSSACSSASLHSCDSRNEARRRVRRCHTPQLHE